MDLAMQEAPKDPSPLINLQFGPNQKKLRAKDCDEDLQLSAK